MATSTVAIAAQVNKVLYHTEPNVMSDRSMDNYNRLYEDSMSDQHLEISETDMLHERISELHRRINEFHVIITSPLGRKQVQSDQPLSKT